MFCLISLLEGVLRRCPIVEATGDGWIKLRGLLNILVLSLVGELDFVCGLLQILVFHLILQLVESHLIDRLLHVLVVRAGLVTGLDLG